jgi:hypothetical protein
MMIHCFIYINNARTHTHESWSGDDESRKKKLPTQKRGRNNNNSRKQAKKENLTWFTLLW